jgi:hypothetical protein
LGLGTQGPSWPVNLRLQHLIIIFTGTKGPTGNTFTCTNKLNNAVNTILWKNSPALSSVSIKILTNLFFVVVVGDRVLARENSSLWLNLLKRSLVFLLRTLPCRKNHYTFPIRSLTFFYLCAQWMKEKKERLVLYLER